MQTRQLGNSDLAITPIGFGAWAIGGGGWAFGWGPQDDADSIAAIHEALDCGVNWIDTAAVYGLGHSEEVVAEALAGISAERRPYVFTKCARVWDEQRQIGKSLKADSIRRECEASLRRLQVDVIDLYQVHWPEPPEDIDEGWQAVQQLKAEGKIRWCGVSNFSAAQMEQVSNFGPITSLQPPLLDAARDIEGRESDACRTVRSTTSARLSIHPCSLACSPERGPRSGTTLSLPTIGAAKRTNNFRSHSSLAIYGSWKC
jgi:aryl-alcohol dehydrogenase-like predicted oxidoreductase